MKANGNKLQKILNNHSNWILSLGKTGTLADFKSRNLDEADLEMANLPFAKFHFVSLRNANLTGINFRQAELLHVNLSNANLDGADLEGANIAEGDFSFSNCSGANFCDANLEGANFNGANLVKANFTRTVLRGAKFKGADLSFSEMVDANLEGANFKGAKLEAVNFGGANLDKADFEETSLKVLNIDEYLPKTNLRGNVISDSLKKKTTSSESAIINQRSHKDNLTRNSNIKSAKEDLFVDSNADKPNLIDEAVLDLIKKVKSSVQIEQVKARCKQQPDIEKIANVDFVHGDIVTHNDQVAFKLDYKVSYKFSLLLDRKGKLIMDFPESLDKP